MNMTLTAFNKSTHHTLLGPNNITPTLYFPAELGSPIILLWPHNGMVFPEKLVDMHGKPLSMDPQKQFQNDPDHNHIKSVLDLHESHDLYMQDLFKTMQRMGIAGRYNHIIAQYSRLVCDINRKWDVAIETGKFTESRNGQKLIIPGNQNLHIVDELQRYQEIYLPYIRQVYKAVHDTIQKFGYVFIFDMHSCTPAFEGKARPPFSSLRTVDSGFIKRFEANMTKKFGTDFQKNGAYNLLDYLLKGENRSNVFDICNELGIPYAGLEFSHLAIDNESKRSANIIRFCDVLERSVEGCINSPDIESHSIKNHLISSFIYSEAAHLKMKTPSSSNPHL